MIVQELKSEFITNEYGIQLRNLYPTSDVNPPFGSAWAIIEANGSTEPHSHHESETFYIVEGSGIMSIDEELRQINKGDVVFIPPFSQHKLSNPNQSNLVFITVWWENNKEEIK